MLQVAPTRGPGADDGSGNDDNANRDKVETGEEPSALPNADERSCTPSDEGDMYACAREHDAEMREYGEQGFTLDTIPWGRPNEISPAYDTVTNLRGQGGDRNVRKLRETDVGPSIENFRREKAYESVTMTKQEYWELEMKRKDEQRLMWDKMANEHHQTMEVLRALVEATSSSASHMQMLTSQVTAIGARQDEMETKLGSRNTDTVEQTTAQ